jgi:NitT/TauT family transport system substrate-binding protein
MEPDKASAAFVARDVDVAVTWEPHLSQVKKNRPDGKVLFTTSDFAGLIVDILIFRNDVIEKHPNTVRLFVDAWYEALEFLQRNPQRGHEIIGKAMELDVAEVGEILSGVKFLGKPENLTYHNKNEQVNVFSVAQVAFRLWKDEGYIEKPIDVNYLIDVRFLNGTSK